MKYKTKLLLIIATGGILTLACFFFGQWNQKPLEYLTRPESGEGNEETEFQIRLNNETYPFRITVKEIPYEEEELLQKLQQAYAGLEELFLSGNRDTEHIVQAVSMPSVYPGSQISLRWYLDSWDYVDSDGTIHNERLEMPVPVKVQAVLSIEEESLRWERTLRVCPAETPTDGQRLKALENMILEAQEENASQLRLPDTVLGETVTWYPKADDRWLWMLALTILSAAAVIAGQRRETDASFRRRERGMQLDYPEIVSRLSLYMGAGISTRNAWERIVDAYEKSEETNQERHAAYEEMRTALREMRSGVAEAAAYERFGTRCRMPAYLKLGTLLSQNLRKGTRNLAEQLKGESREAFEDRKALAKRMGEECESKLLIPMMMMLLTILIIIMYPAASSFQI